MLIIARSVILVLMSEYHLEIERSWFLAEERRKELEFDGRGGMENWLDLRGEGKRGKRASVLICIYDHDLMRYVCKDYQNVFSDSLCTPNPMKLLYIKVQFSYSQVSPTPLSCWLESISSSGGLVQSQHSALHEHVN